MSSRWSQQILRRYLLNGYYYFFVQYESVNSMDYFQIKLKLNVGVFISIAGKNIPMLVKEESLAAKYGKVLKIWACEVGKFCISQYYPRKNSYHFSKTGNAFSRVVLIYAKFGNFAQLYFSYFSTLLHQTFQLYILEPINLLSSAFSLTAGNGPFLYLER